MASPDFVVAPFCRSTINTVRAFSGNSLGIIFTGMTTNGLSSAFCIWATAHHLPSLRCSQLNLTYSFCAVSMSTMRKTLNGKARLSSSPSSIICISTLPATSFVPCGTYSSIPTSPFRTPSSWHPVKQNSPLRIDSDATEFFRYFIRIILFFSIDK